MHAFKPKRPLNKYTKAEMSFIEHIDVLRWHLIRACIAVAIFAILAFYFYDFLFDKVIMGPKKPSFWTYQILCKIAENFHLGASLCIKEIPFTIINTEMAGQFTLQMNSSLVMGFTLGVPYLLYEIWSFIKPGLKASERKAASGFVFYTSILFAIGILFGYYFIAPLSINFLANYRVSPEIQNQITINSYLSSMITLTLGTGMIFELPIIIYILAKIGLLSATYMRSKRRYAIVAILVLAAIVSPSPDVPTMLTVSFPLFVLYEASLVVASRVEKKRKESLT